MTSNPNRSATWPLLSFLTESYKAQYNWRPFFFGGWPLGALSRARLVARVLLPLHAWIDALRGGDTVLDADIRDRLGAAASAQSLYAAVSAGLGSGFVMLAAGALYSAYGGQAYLFMALLSAAGLVGIAALARLARR